LALNSAYSRFTAKAALLKVFLSIEDFAHSPILLSFF